MKKSVIICVDDEKMVLQSLAKELKAKFSLDYSIEIAESGEEALELIEELISDNCEIPVLISDYIMPQMKGDDFLINAKRLLGDSKSILLTGQATIEGVSTAINKANLYRYIGKPWESDDLVLTISEALKSYKDQKLLVEQNEEIKRKNKEISDINVNLENLVRLRTAELEAKTQEITDSINYAYRIQQAVMRPVSQIEVQYPCASVLYIPKSIVSGDFYWLSEKDDKMIIVAGDCTGHGVPGAFMSLIGIIFLNEIINEKGITTPGEILYELREKVIYLLQQTGSDNEAKDGMDISLVTIDKSTNILEFAGAHNHCYLLGQPSNLAGYTLNGSHTHHDSLLIIKSDNIPIGISDRLDTPFTNHTIQLYPGDSIFLTTDGYFDQFGGPNGKKFMARRFRDALVKLDSKSISQQIGELKSAYLSWKGQEEQIDDVLLIGLRIECECQGDVPNHDTLDHVLSSFRGILTDQIISSLCEKLENDLIKREVNKRIVKNVLNVSVECLQNIYNYTEKIDGSEINSLESSFSVILNKGLISIHSTNFIKPSAMDKIKNKIDFVNSLSADQLKEEYMKVLDNSTFNEKHGAGLGLIVMARKTENKIEYNFTKLSDTIVKYDLMLKYNL